MDPEEARVAYPEIYAGFNALEWARDGGKRHPAQLNDMRWIWPPSTLPAQVWDEIDGIFHATWSAAMSALVKAARSAYAKGWRRMGAPGRSGKP